MLICDKCYTDHREYIDFVIQPEDIITWNEPWFHKLYNNEYKTSTCDICDNDDKCIGEISFKVSDRTIVKIFARLKTLDDKVEALSEKLDSLSKSLNPSQN